MATQTIELQTEEHFGRRLPPRHLGYLLVELPVAVKHAISMALRNRSSMPGRHPQWLDRAADIRFVGHEGNGEATLHFEAPTLGEAAQELYRQQELWPDRPEPEDTGFDLLGDVLSEIAERNVDSKRFDPPMLRQIDRFGRVFQGPYMGMNIVCRRHTVGHPASISPQTIETARTFYQGTPAPRQVRVTGWLDMLRASTQTFALRLDDDQEIRGVLPDGSIEDVKPLWNRRVLVLGRAVYRPSGRLLRVDAARISAGDTEPSIWSRMPEPGTAKLDTSRLRRPQSTRSGMAAIMGHWPGDESDEEIEAALERLS